MKQPVNWAKRDPFWGLFLRKEALALWIKLFSSLEYRLKHYLDA